DDLVPQPGIEPGRLNWARGCKPRLYANFSTGAQAKSDVGTEGLERAVPALFGQSGAALSLSSSSIVSLNSRDNLEQLACGGTRLRQSCVSEAITTPPAFSNDDNVAVAGELIKHSISASDCETTSSGDTLHDFRARDSFVLSQHF